jgi:hypothetical protein
MENRTLQGGDSYPSRLAGIKGGQLRSRNLHRDPASRRRRRKGKPQIWDSKIWSRVPRDSDPRETALARASSIYKWQIRPLVREGAPQKQDHNCQTVINIWSWAPHGAPHQDLLTDWPSVAMWLWLWLLPAVQKWRKKNENATEFQKARVARCKQQWRIRDPIGVECVNCYNRV